MTDQAPAPAPVTVLLENDSITQLVSHKDNLYALTSFGFVLLHQAPHWYQVPAPLDIALARQLQPSPEEESSNGQAN